MPKIRDIIVPALGGLNSDDDLNMMNVNDSPTSTTDKGRENIEFIEGTLGAVSNPLGNTIIGGVLVPAGLCSAYDSKRDEIIWVTDFYGLTEGKIYSIDRDHNIGGVEGYIVNNESQMKSFQDYLALTDGATEPMCFNRNFSPVATRYDDGVTADVYLIKLNPIKKPVITIETDTSFKSNFIRGNTYQFAYRYVYEDKMKSSYSPPSELVYNYMNDFPDGSRSLDIQIANRIDIDIDVRSETVRRVEIIARVGDVGSGAYSNWVFVDSIEIPYVNSTTTTIGTYTYEFFNDKIYSEVDQKEANSPFYDVPLKANAIEVIDDNRIVLAGITRGYDNIDLDIAFDVVESRIDVANRYAARASTDIVSIATSASGDVDVVKTAEELSHMIIIWDTNGDILEEYKIWSDNSIADTNALIDWFIAEINGNTSLSIVASRVSSKLRIANTTGSTFSVTWYALPLITLYSGINDKVPTFIPGSYINLGIIYYDEYGRQSRVQRDENCTIYIPRLSEATYNNPIYSIKYTIGHNPPSWAKYWQFAYGGSNVKSYFTVPIQVISTTNYPSVDISFENNKTIIDLPQVIDRLSNNLTDVKVKTFEPQKGDIIRFSSVLYNTPDNIFTYNDVLVLFTTETVEFEILEIDDQGRIVIKSVSGIKIEDILKGVGLSSLIIYVNIELLRINKNFTSDKSIYVGVGDVLEIDTYHDASVPTTINHGVTKVDQTALLDAVGVLNFGNIYCYPRTFYNSKIYNPNGVPVIITTWYHEYAIPSILSTNYERGKISLVDKEYEQRYDNAIMWGGRLSEKGLVYNELNKFYPENIIYLDEKDGDICSIKQKGYVLHVFQQNKVTYIDIGRVSQVLSDGSVSYVSVKAVLGSKRPSTFQYGTIFPFSVVPINNDIYFVDIYTADICRVEGNGIRSITDGKYKMRKYMKDKCRALLASGIENISIYGGHDPVRNLYVVTFIDEDTAANNDTIAFSLERDRWVTHYSYIGKHYVAMGESAFYSIRYGLNLASLYKHHVNETRNNFYGTQYSSKIKILSNKNPESTKRFLGIKETANKIWEAPNTNSIIINPNATVVSDPKSYTKHYLKMQSELKEGQFIPRDNEYVAEFLRDNTTTTGSANTVDLINGRPLMGREIVVKLENDDTTESILNMVKIDSLIRE